jgi:dipeptidyl aminopeptidase/acylaminoacyl peptidase
VLSLIQEGFIDPERIGVQGHSWGGYQIAWMITRTNLFAAAEAGAPVSNMTSAYGGIRWQSGRNRQSQYERGQSRIGGSLWEETLRYIENSPLFEADKIHTPLLMLHNDEDGDAAPPETRLDGQLQWRAPRSAQEAEPEGLDHSDAAVLRPLPDGRTGTRVDG